MRKAARSKAWEILPARKFSPGVNEEGRAILANMDFEREIFAISGAVYGAMNRIFA